MEKRATNGHHNIDRYPCYIQRLQVTLQDADTQPIVTLEIAPIMVSRSCVLQRAESCCLPMLQIQSWRDRPAAPFMDDRGEFVDHLAGRIRAQPLS